MYATRWSNDRTGRSGWSPAVAGGPANARRPDRKYLPLTDEVLAAHLTGTAHVGLFPLLPDDTCRLLACDFDGSTWQLDARAFVDAARAAQVPVALERSQSGNGGHVWMFFTGPVLASATRRVAAYLLREAMTVRAELDLGSYDRFFPAQDYMPKGSFGNLIGLPLQGVARQPEAVTALRLFRATALGHMVGTERAADQSDLFRRGNWARWSTPIRRIRA